MFRYEHIVWFQIPVKIKHSLSETVNDTKHLFLKALDYTLLFPIGSAKLTTAQYDDNIGLCNKYHFKGGLPVKHDGASN